MLPNSPNSYRRVGLTLGVGVLTSALACWCVSPHAAQAIGLPLAWGKNIASASNHQSHSADDGLLTETTQSIALIANNHADSNSATNLPVNQPPVVAMTYTQSDVMQWAYDHSPAASLIDSEAIAVRRGINTEDSDGCCAARLVQSVLQEVALARRSDSANEAAIAYHKLLAATQAIELADQAIAVQDKLIRLAAEAERLDIRDANPLKLRQTRLDLVDLKIEQSFNTLKLRQELSRLTGRQEAEVAVAIMIDSLPDDAPSIAAGDAVAQALAQRHDLRAVQVLCEDLNRCNLDAARLLMGTLSPGAGLSLAVAATGILKCLKADTTDNDFNARRAQCEELQDSLRSVIRNETLQAVLDVRSAGARLGLVDEQLQFATERLEEARGKIEIDEALPGSDLVVELEIYQLRGNRLTRQKDLAIAIDNLNHATGTPVR